MGRLKVHFVRKLIFESRPQLVKYRCFEMAANLTYNPKASVFDKLEMRLKKYNFLQNGPWLLSLISDHLSLGRGMYSCAILV